MSLFKVYRRNPDTDAPELVMQDPTAVGSTLGTANLAADLATLASKDYVASAIADISLASLKGKVDDEAALNALTGMKNGDIYLVGTDGAESYEEFIYFEEGAAWERFGSVRASDVDLSAYSTTEEMNSAIAAAQATVQGNLDAAKTELQGAIDQLQTDLESAMGELDADLVVVDTLPAEWPADVTDAGVLMVVTAVTPPAPAEG